MAGRFCGHSDPELNVDGRAQLTALVEALAGERFVKVYSSDLRRASSTAQALAAVRQLPVELRPALREIHFGRWEGLCWAEIEQMDGAYAAKWVGAYPDLPAPAGEDLQAFEARVLAEVRQLGRQSVPIAVVTHAGVMRVVLRHLCGCTESAAWEQTRSYCCVVRYEPEVEEK